MQRDGVQRMLNAVALLLIIVGVGVYLYALWRMEAIAGGATVTPPAGGPIGAANITRWHELRRLSNIGLGVAVTGVLSAVGATLRHSLRTRRPTNGQANDS